MIGKIIIWQIKPYDIVTTMAKGSISVFDEN